MVCTSACQSSRTEQLMTPVEVCADGACLEEPWSVWCLCSLVFEAFEVGQRLCSMSISAPVDKGADRPQQSDARNRLYAA
jgi:hypothetical protein